MNFLRKKLITDSADELYCIYYRTPYIRLLSFPVFLPPSLFTSFCLSTQSFFPLLSSILFLRLLPQLFRLSASLPSLLTGDFFPSLFRFIALSSAALPFSSLIALPHVLSLPFYSSLSLSARALSLPFPSWHHLLVHTLSFLARSFVRSIVIFQFFNLFYLFLTCIFISDSYLFFFHSHFISLVFFLSYSLTLSLLHIGFSLNQFLVLSHSPAGICPFLTFSLFLSHSYHIFFSFSINFFSFALLYNFVLFT